MTPEGRVKAKVRELLKEIGAYQYWPVPYGMGSAGVDVYACYKGRFYAIECKREKGGRLTGRQRSVLDDVVASGGGSCVEDTLECTNVRKLLGL
jgi:hypothetical protein